jgi:hypothetical protein
MTATLNPQDPKAYILAHDKRVIQLDRMPIASLRSIYRDLLTEAGTSLIYGGPVDKDEFISAIIELEFPEVRAAREAYVSLMVG